MIILGFIYLSSEIDYPVTTILITMFRLISTTESVSRVSQTPATLNHPSDSQQPNKETRPPNAAWTQPGSQRGSDWWVSRGQQMDRVLSGMHSQCASLVLCFSPLHSRLPRGKWESFKYTGKRRPSQAPVNQTGISGGFCCNAGVTRHNVTPAAL